MATERPPRNQKNPTRENLTPQPKKRGRQVEKPPTEAQRSATKPAASAGAAGAAAPAKTAMCRKKETTFKPVHNGSQKSPTKKGKDSARSHRNRHRNPRILHTPHHNRQTAKRRKRPTGSHRKNQRLPRRVRSPIRIQPLQRPSLTAVVACGDHVGVGRGHSGPGGRRNPVGSCGWGWWGVPGSLCWCVWFWCGVVRCMGKGSAFGGALPRGLVCCGTVTVGGRRRKEGGAPRRARRAAGPGRHRDLVPDKGGGSPGCTVACVSACSRNVGWCPVVSAGCPLSWPSRCLPGWGGLVVVVCGVCLGVVCGCLPTARCREPGGSMCVTRRARSLASLPQWLALPGLAVARGGPRGLPSRCRRRLGRWPRCGAPATHRPSRLPAGAGGWCRRGVVMGVSPPGGWGERWCASVPG